MGLGNTLKITWAGYFFYSLGGAVLSKHWKENLAVLMLKITKVKILKNSLQAQVVYV